MPGSPSLAGVTGAQLVFPKPTRSIAEVEPSLLWSPAVLAGELRWSLLLVGLVTF
jgi:hypothetical protein